MSQTVHVGAAIDGSLESVQRFYEEGLGDLVHARIPATLDEALAVARFCREHQIYFAMYQFYKIGGDFEEFHPKYPVGKFFTKEDLRKIVEAFGPYYIGRVTLNEIGGCVYWPKEYLIGSQEAEWESLEPARDMAEAKAIYVNRLRRLIEKERAWGPGKLSDLDASILFKYHREAGVDLSHLELMPADASLSFPAIRGASRAGEDSRWGAYIAMTCYGGRWMDALFMKRWKLALYLSYLSGADFIYSEDGHFGNYWEQIGGVPKEESFRSPGCVQYRSVLRDFYRFCQGHPRPEHGPKVKLGIVHGHLDGYPGLWSRYVWGQFGGEQWKHGPAEWSWDYLEDFHRRETWQASGIMGETDFSGQPPYGQYDIVPIESPLEHLNRYSCLVFLGWNTVTDEIYEKLRDYVESGGHLIMAVPHLSTHVRREEDLRLFRDGDLRDLFGVRVLGKGEVVEGGGIKYVGNALLESYRFSNWGLTCDPKFVSGDIPTARVELSTARVIAATACHFSPEKEKATHPVLVENVLGAGHAFLITTWCYPGETGLRLFMKDLLQTVLLGEQGAIRVAGSDRVHYAVYEEEGNTTVYLLNTDFDTPQSVNVHANDQIIPVTIPECDLKILSLKDENTMNR